MSLVSSKLKAMAAPAYRIESFIPVIAHAVAVFGDETKATHWLATPLAILDGKSPSQVLVESGGIDRVETILSRIEHNIPS